MYCIPIKAKLVGVDITYPFAYNGSYGPLKSENVIRLIHVIFLLAKFWLIQIIKMSNQGTLTEEEGSIQLTSYY
jgi:hypothetical protein